MWKKIILCTITCIVCFIVGLSVPKINKLALTDENSMTINNTNIIIEKDVDNNIVDAYITDIKTLPDYLLKNCNSIIFTSENLNDKFNLELKNTILAVTVDDIIYVNDSKFKSGVIIHELFHVYDFTNDWISMNNSEFINIYDNEKEIISVSPGNNQNAQEFFATIGAEYFTNPEDLSKNAPQSYNFIKTILGDD